ncbi:MAG: hypothetical protein J3K34DRAFT_179158 [Monoraphidium minutum]|nr:MAG: hypothetical protein J3K34DRAFT_179158 [Monoraphidium minutum]
MMHPHGARGLHRKALAATERDATVRCARPARAGLRPRRRCRAPRCSSQGAPHIGAAAANGAAGAASSTATAEELAWLHLDAPLLWRGTADTVLAPGSPLTQLTPTWRMMLLSDGSVTRHLELLTGEEMTVECTQMQELGPADAAGVPEAARRIPSPLLQRQVLLRSAAGPPLVYAASWWCARTVGRYLADARRPIWKSLSAGQVEVYREILEVYHGHSPELEAALQCPGPFWGRAYFFHHSGRPLTLIHEVFSNRLEAHLGPQWAAGGGGGAAGGAGERQGARGRPQAGGAR